MAQTTVNEILQTPGIEDRIMKATGLTKNVVSKMLSNANETEDEVEKARILSHFIWHMPAGQLQATPEAQAVKKELIQDLANEIGTEMPEEWSSLEIVVSDKIEGEEDAEPDVEPSEEETVAPNVEEQVEQNNEAPAEADAPVNAEANEELLFKFSSKKAKKNAKSDVGE